MTDLASIFVGTTIVFMVVCVGIGAVTAEMYARLNSNPPWAQNLGNQINDVRDKIMAAVQIEQTDLDAFAGTVTTEVTAISAAVSVIQSYIAKLIAGQATPLAAADETALTSALSGLATSVGTLTGLEPPAPTPGS